MYENSKIIKLCIAKLKEKYGDDFKLEVDDEFVFTLNDSVLILKQEEKTMKIKYMLDTAIHLDVNLFNEGDKSDA